MRTDLDIYSQEWPGLLERLLARLEHVCNEPLETSFYPGRDTNALLF